MKRISLFVIFLSLLFSSISIISAQGGLLTSFTTIVNFRAGPGVEWRVMATPPQGTTVLLDGQAYEGTWVRGIIPDGTVGWTLTEYVTISVEQALSLPVVYVETPFTLPAPPQQGEIVSAPQQPAEQASESQAAETAAPVSTGLTSGIGATATARLNMRYGPSTEYVVVDGIEIGGTLNVDGRSGNSLWIRGITTSGKVGWVFAEYTSLNIDQINALPVVGVDTPFSLGAPAGAPAAPAEAPPEQAEVPAAPPAAPIASTAPVSGFSYGGHVQGFSDASANWMRVAGMTWVKKQWRYVDGQDAGAAAGMIADAHNRGFRIMVGVIGVSPTDLNNGGYYDRFAGFVAGLAGLGADGIEIWNEPNIDREWPTGQIDGARYTQLLAAAFNSIKSTNPNTMGVSGAPALPASTSALPTSRRMQLPPSGSGSPRLSVHHRPRSTPSSSPSLA